ncbi:MAG: hypothetical protein KJ649_04935 [Proteobacteria bacterium]|nr:hypothetical protein [Pseudomonadota bacterium]
MGDVLTTDDLQLMIAVERAKARGVDVEVIPLKSDELAVQAVINGQEITVHARGSGTNAIMNLMAKVNRRAPGGVLCRQPVTGTT